MMNKKAFEMSVGMIVIIILSVLIFSLSLYFVFKWFGSAEQLKAEIDRQTQEQITAALRTGNQLVAVPVSIIETKRGMGANFGIGIRNIQAQKTFSMATTFSGAYTPDGKLIPVDQRYIEEKWLGSFTTTPDFVLKKNEEKLIPILIRANVNIASGTLTPKGDYTFNVCVYDAGLRSDGTPPAACTSEQFKRGIQNLYTNKINQVVIKVI